MLANVFAKGANGLPTTQVVDVLDDKLTYIDFSHAALWGPLTATVRFSADLATSMAYAEQYLGNPIEIYSPDGTLQWRGMIWKVTFANGRRKRVRSLDGYANRAYVNYAYIDSNGVSQGDAAAFQDDAAQQAIYGLIQTTVAGGSLTGVDAGALATQTLNSAKRLLWNPDSGNSTLGVASTQAPQVELMCFGMYHTLWYQWSNVYSAASGTVDSSVMIKNILLNICPWVSSDQSQIQATGTLVPQNQPFTFVSGGEMIKAFVAMTDGWTFGIDLQDRAYVRPSNRYNASADYIERTDGLIETPAGQELRLWDVRPDTILKQQDFVPPSANLVTAIDSIEHIYLAQTTFATPYQLTFQAAIAGPDAQVSAT